MMGLVGLKLRLGLGEKERAAVEGGRHHRSLCECRSLARTRSPFYCAQGEYNTRISLTQGAHGVCTRFASLLWSCPYPCAAAAATVFRFPTAWTETVGAETLEQAEVA